MDFISELVASTDDEDFAVLLADVECLPDEVLETLAAVLQSCAGRGWIAATMNLDRHALERVGHYIVSRRVALAYRNRTDLADSLQFTVRTLADIEHGVRKASPGTYAMLENKLAWSPGSIDTILAGGEPNELVSTLHRGNPNTPSQGYALRPTNPNALSQVSTEELLLELRRRIITPRDRRHDTWGDWDDWDGGGLDPHGDWPEQG